ncbi:MAG: hypothetical protein GEV06_26605 [Luteitalea sp.]|nr:hypothetical protein [Luteitalea sp.]
MRQLIERGDHKAAVEQAKDIHRASRSGASEALLVDAYAARIEELRRRNLTLEAQALVDLVCKRYPSAKRRFAELPRAAQGRAPSLVDLVRPLADPMVDADKRLAIEQALQREVTDLSALASCETLPAAHPLRQAAAALDRAFTAVTSGPVAEEALLLPEVSHRSPLAAWKLLIKAIAAFHRGDDDACQQFLDRIKPDSAPARLVPPLQAMMRNQGTGCHPAAKALISVITSERAAFQRALDDLEQAFTSGRRSRILKAIRAAVQACEQSAPAQLESLRQHISIRAAAADLDPMKVRAAMGGPSRHDATFLQLFARAMEEARDPEKISLACHLWEEFKQAAVKEGWFAVNGAEAAALALRIAGLLQQLPDDLLQELQWSAEAKAKKTGETFSYLYPEQMYQRACALDPHPAAFSQWMQWAARRSDAQAERVAEAWHKLRSRDIEPLVHLLRATEARGAFKLALGYLTKTEQIDGLHAEVRDARFRILVKSALRHLERKKPHLAADDVGAGAALPQAQQGDRPAIVAALRTVTSAACGQTDAVDVARAEVEHALQSEGAAALLIFSLASASKQRAVQQRWPLGRPARRERSSMPMAVARVAVLCADVGVPLEVPRAWLTEVARQLTESQHLLDVVQLHVLGEAACQADHLELAYAASAAGLERGGATDPGFLFLRARSVILPEPDRCLVCASAAAELARHARETELVENAVELCRTLAGFDGALPLTLDQARDVLGREKAARKPPRGSHSGPSYDDLLGAPCQCAVCRRRRGEGVDPFEELDEEDDPFDMDIPPGMPPAIAEIFIEVAKEAAARGQSLEEFMADPLNEPPRPKRRRKKGRRW